MATVKSSKDKPFPIRVPREGVAGYRKLNPILSFLLKKAGFKLSTDGIDSQEIEDGLHLKGLGTAGEDVNFNVSASGLITPGTYDSVIPTLNGTSLAASPAPTLTIPSSGAFYVYVRAEYSLTASESDFTYAASFTAVTIQTSTSAVSTPQGPSGQYFYFLIATFVDGSKTFQRLGGDMQSRIDGGSDSKATIALV